MRKFAQDTVETAQTHRLKVAAAAYLLGSMQCAMNNGEHCFTGENPAVQTALLFLSAAAMMTAAKSTVAARVYNSLEHSAAEVARIGAPAVQRIVGIFRKKPVEGAAAVKPTDKNTIKKGP